MLDYTWSELEAEIVLRNLNAPSEEQQRLRGYYQQLRDQYSKVTRSSAPVDPEPSAG